MDNKSDNNHLIKEDIQGLKQDIENLIVRFKSLKSHSVDSLSEQLNGLSDILNEYKDKGTQVLGRDNLTELYLSTRKHPMRNLFYAFSAGVLISWLLKK